MRRLACLLVACAFAGCGDDKPASPVLPDPAKPPKPKVSAAPAQTLAPKPGLQETNPHRLFAHIGRSAHKLVLPGSA